MRRALALVALLVLVALPLRGALDVGFLQDDYNVAQLLGSELALDGPTLYRLFHPPADEQDARLRPLTYLTLALDLAVFGLDPLALHLSGLLFHLISTALVFVLAGVLAPRARAFPWVAALFFGLAPVHADAVAWLAARADPVAGTFVLATLLAYVRYRRTARPLAAAACLLLYAAALLSKEAAVITPGLALLLEPALRRRPRPGGLVPALSGLGLLTAAYLLYRRHLFGVFLGHYGARDAASWSVAPGDVTYAGRMFLADVPGSALASVLLLAPIVFGAVCLVIARRPLRARSIAAGALLFLLAIVVAVLPVAPFLGQASGRHFYLAAAPLAGLLAAAVTVPRRRAAGAALLPAALVLLYGAASVLGLRTRIEMYVEASAITAAVARDLGALRAAHPDVAVFVVGDLRSAWRRAPLLHSGAAGLAQPPFQREPVPIRAHFAGQPRDYRWEAYVIRKPAVFLRLRTAAPLPGLEPVSPILRSLPPREEDPAYACLSPAAGAAVRLDGDTPFRFRIPADLPWPIRLVFALPGDRVAPLLIGATNVVEEPPAPDRSRTLVWRPRQGALGLAAALPLEAPPAAPVGAAWWIEEADLEHAGVRTVRASPVARFVVQP
ncbi:MAG: hypothetical protein JXQ29_03810 [Planctomycetes bacterium]|nr:hypothetical protein [Planctomycetota bacterium]